LHAEDETEHIAGFREIAVDDLPTLADHLERVGEARSDAERAYGNWAAWGRFRAITHRVVWQALQG
jgi:hypothetical protein